MNPQLRTWVRRALMLAAVGSASTAAAQSVQEIEVVVITGSYIEGTAEDAALPVEVLTADDLEKQGSPSTVDLVKAIPAVQGILGESNQFGAAQNTGVSNINLRGLGAVRTLVLFNGRRVATSASASVGVDTNLLPTAAVGRIEVLKDGAAATYGSDAIGGVVNFISREGVDGLSIDGSYSYIEDTDGDYSTNIVWGDVGETYDLMVSASYRHRSELQARDRDFALRPLNENPQGGFSSFGNPGVYQLLNPTRTAPIGSFRDPGCAPLGGIEADSGGLPSCLFQFTQFDNVVEREEHYNVYGEFNSQLRGTTNLRLEAFYAAHDVPQENSSPSYAPLQGVGANPLNPSNAPNFFIPLNNPGLVALLPSLTAEQRAAIGAAGGVLASGLQWRPLGLGGNPLTGEGKQDSRFFDAFRVSAALDGELKGVGWNFALSYSENERDADTPDILVSQLDRALRGFGGPNCTGTTPGAAANGCSFFNPFSTGIASNPITGAANPAAGSGGTFAASTANDPEVVRALFGNFGLNDTARLLVADLVLDGELGMNLPGGKIGWAAGAQYREDGFELNLSDAADTGINPCPDTPVTGNSGCATATGPLSFLGTLPEVDLSDDVYGVFTELSLPLLQRLQAQIAYRYEDYGGEVGSTSNPKLSVRWQATPWLGMRASYGSTFRGPLQSQLLDGSITTLQFTSLSRPVATPLGTVLQNISGFRAFDNFGNSSLQPEDADTLNAGLLFNAGPFNAAIDYYSIELRDPISSENGTDIVREFFGTADSPENHCGEAAFAGLQSRFTFVGGLCAPQNLLRTRANTINGPEERAKGIDLRMQYRFDKVFKGALTAGVDASYLLEYKRDEFFIEGVEIEDAGGRDFAGTRGSFATLPELRGSVYLDWGTAVHNVRLTSRYIDGMTDLRTAVADPVTGRNFEVGSYLTHDLVYRIMMPGEMTLTTAVFNFTDRDPPLVRLELSYDPFIANPLGRVVKVALSKRFD
jgi:iron complex outermembrane receptor protein